MSGWSGFTGTIDPGGAGARVYPPLAPPFQGWERKPYSSASASLRHWAIGGSASMR